MMNIVIVPFYELSEKEKLLILHWRNDESIRKWMYSTETIEQKNHFKFIEKLKIIEDKQYFLVCKDKTKIGVIYFTDIDMDNRYCEFGLYSNPELKGMGSILMDTICEYAFKMLGVRRLVAEVFSNNQKATHLYLGFGFKYFDKKNINGQEVICMELKNENR